jgi:DNA-binding beta-propeller fold protein YncE
MIDFENGLHVNNVQSDAATVSGFTGNVVASCIMDSLKWSDGGAKRKQLTHTSWYNEVTTATGKWLGFAANETAARALGGQTGDYYCTSTSPLFYSLNATSGQTQVYRGSRAEMPEKILWTAEAGRVIGWDITDSTMPMWMVFNAVANTMLYTATTSCITSTDDKLIVGATSFGLKVISFSGDYGTYTNGGGTYLFNGNIAERNASRGVRLISTLPLVNQAVNSVAATILPNAPIDQATGMPIPTIAVGTAGGVSVIKDDGTAVNSALTTTFQKVSFTSNYDLLASSDGFTASLVYSAYAYLSAGFTHRKHWSNTTVPALLRSNPIAATKALRGAMYSFGYNTGLNMLMDNPASPLSGMVVAITSTYNSGWMVGDIRGCWGGSTVAEVTNGWTSGVNIGTYATGVRPRGVAFDVTNNAVWIVNNISNNCTKFNAATGAVIGTYATGTSPYGVAFDVTNNAVWVANYTANTCTKFNAATGAVIGTYATGTNPIGVAFDVTNNAVWVSNNASSTCTKFNAATGAVIGTYATGANPREVAFDVTNNAVWVSNYNANTCTKLNAATGAVIGTYATGTNPYGVSFDVTNNAVWVANNASNNCTKFNAATGAVIGTYATGANPYGVSFDVTNNAVWTADYTSNSCTKFNATTGAVIGKYATGTGPLGVAFDVTNNAVWVSNYLTSTCTKLNAAVNVPVSYVADLSVKAQPLEVVGTLTKAAIATGAQLMSWSGFSAANYLQQASNPNWNAIGTGDFSIRLDGVKWGAATGAYRTILTLGDGLSTGSVLIGLTPSNLILLSVMLLLIHRHIR